MAKKRLVKNYEALTPEILEDLKAKYPNGYEQHLIKYTDKDGKFVSALPFDTEEAYYLIRMTIQEAKRIDSAEYDDDDAIRSDMDIEVDAEFDGQGEEDDDLNDGMDDESDHIIVTRRRDSDDADDIADDSDY